MYFESETITLDIPMEGIYISGWIITPLMRPVVSFYDTINIHHDNFTQLAIIIESVDSISRDGPDCPYM